MRLKIEDKKDALHPSEIVVTVSTVNGRESLVVDRSSVTDDTIEVGQPIGSELKKVLVELPRETNSGSWRVWVLQDNLVGVAA